MNYRYVLRLVSILVLVFALGRTFYLLENPPDIHLNFLDLLSSEEAVNVPEKVTTRPPVTASPLDERRGEVPTRSFFDLPRLEAYFPYVGGKRRGRQQSLSPRGEPLPEKNIIERQWMHQAIVALEFGSKKELLENVKSSFEKICNHEIIKRCHFFVKKNFQRELFNFYWPYRQYLLSHNFIDEINRDQGNKYVNKIQMGVLSSFGYQQAASLNSDPLQVMESFFHSVSSSLSFKTENGFFVKEEGGIFYAFGFLEVKDKDNQSEVIFSSHIQQLRFLLRTKFYITSPLLYAASGAESSMNEARAFSFLSLITIALLLFIVFSSFKPLFISLCLIVLSSLQGFLLTELIFGHIHIVTLLLSVGTLGVIADYCIHYFVHSSQGATELSLKKIIKPLTLSLLTSLSGYLMFLTGSIEELKQLSLFSVTSLLSAYLYVLLFFPMFSVKKLNTSSLLMKKIFGKRIEKNKTLNMNRKLLKVVIALLILFIILPFTLSFNDDASLLQQKNRDLDHQEKKIRSILGFKSYPHSYLILSQDIQTLLLKEENLRTRILRKNVTTRSSVTASPLDERRGADEERRGRQQSLSPRGEPLYKNKDILVRGVSSWVPSLKRQEESLDRYKQLYPIVYQLYTLLGVPGADEKAQKVYTVVDQQKLEFEEWYEEFKNTLVVGDYLGKINGKHLSRVVQFGGEMLSSGELSQGVYSLDKRSEISKVFKLLRQKILWILLSLILLVLLVLIGFYGLAKSCFILMPPLFGLLFSSIVSSSYFGFMNLFDCLALILIFFLGIDYSFFMQFSDSDIESHTHLAISVSLLTTIFSFGILIFSTTSAMQHFGLTMVVGMISSYLVVTQLGRSQ